MAREVTRESVLWDGIDEGEHAVFLKLVRCRLDLTLKGAAELTSVSPRILRDIELGTRPLHQFAFEVILKEYHDEEVRQCKS